MDPAHNNPNVSSEAQAEFDSLFATKAANHHPEDSDVDDDKLFEELDEEAEHIQKRIAETMRMPTLDGMPEMSYRLPDESFDRGRRTGVKGIVADARQELRKMSERNGRGESEARETDEDRAILAMREIRMNDIRKRRDAENDIRNRRKHAEYGTFNTVDAAGLDNVLHSAPRDTVVAIFIYDSAVSPNLLLIYKDMLTSRFIVGIKQLVPRRYRASGLGAPSRPIRQNPPRATGLRTCWRPSHRGILQR